MLIAAYIVLAIAFGISNMVLFYRCAEITPIRLSRGLFITFLVSVVQTVLFLLGMFLGDILRFELPTDAEAFSKTNSLIFLGLDLFVMLRMLMPYLKRESQLPIFNLGSNSSCVAMAFATAINLLLVGLGAGFVASLAMDIHKALWPLIIILFLAGYWGLMLGRTKVNIRPRRWMIVASVLLLAVSIAAVVNA